MLAGNEQRRDKAIRLLSLFVSKGMSVGVTVANPWILDVAAQNGIGDQDLLAGLNYAAEQNWITIESEGLQLIATGAAATITGSNVAA